jgi:hypothetical protein
MIQQVRMNLLDRTFLDALDQLPDAPDAVLMDLEGRLPTREPILHQHELLPVLQHRAVLVCPFLLVSAGQERLEDPQELWLHQKIAHGFDNIVVSSGWEEHVVDPFFAEWEHNAAEEVPQDVEVPEHLQDGVLGQVDADGLHDRRFPDLRDVESNRGKVESETDAQHHQELSAH